MPSSKPCGVPGIELFRRLFVTVRHSEALVSIVELSKAAPKMFDFRADESHLRRCFYVPFVES